MFIWLCNQLHLTYHLAYIIVSKEIFKSRLWGTFVLICSQVYMLSAFVVTVKNALTAPSVYLSGPPVFVGDLKNT